MDETAGGNVRSEDPQGVRPPADGISRPVEAAGPGQGKLPCLAVAAAFVVLTVAAAREQFRLPWLGLIFCTAVLTGCVVARQILAQRENMRMAVTDGLTGLTNRMGFNEPLQQALHRRGTTAVLVADLDDVKRVNDTARARGMYEVKRSRKALIH